MTKKRKVPRTPRKKFPITLGFVNGVVGSDYLLPLNVNRETLQESQIIKFIPKKVVRKAIEVLCNLEENKESKKEKDYDIDDETKKVEITENR